MVEGYIEMGANNYYSYITKKNVVNAVTLVPNRIGIEILFKSGKGLYIQIQS
jgi:hypothetical protein